MDTREIRRQVYAAIHRLDRMGSHERFWHGELAVRGEIVEIANQALEVLATGDRPGALALLEAVTDAYLEEGEGLDDDTGFVYEELASLWDDVLLKEDLSPAERQSWAEKLTAWQRQIDDLGFDGIFDVAAIIADLQAQSDSSEQQKKS
jgi:hypothetical protein